MNDVTTNYGQELILDLHNCNPEKFNRSDIGQYFDELCDLIKMQKHDRHFWDYMGLPEEYEKAPAHLKGTSAVQFISTSDIVIHALDVLRHVHLNIFSCKSFDMETVKEYTVKFFEGRIVQCVVLDRK